MTEPVRPRRLSPRSLVQRELARSSRFRTVNELHLALASQDRPASLSTVYRTLTALTRSGLVETLYLPSAGVGYRLRIPETTGPYLVCVTCGTAEPAPAGDLTPWFRAVAAQQGFTDVEPRIELWGRCPGCRPILNENGSHS
jgi:Fur family transcriptional regulator, ferric uptake regulator